MATVNLALNEWPFDRSVIKDVLTDLELMEAGVRLILFVDPYDIVEFCFPAGFYSTVAEIPSTQSILESQAALGEMFYNSPHPIVLAREYIPEVNRILGFLRWQAQRGFGRVESMQQTLLDGLTMVEVINNKSSTRNILKAAESDLHVAVAVAMGLFSSGVDRFVKVTSRQVTREEDLRDPAIIGQCLAIYRESSRLSQIFDAFFSAVHVDSTNSLEHERHRRSALADARVVDRILEVNSALRAAFEARAVHKRWVCLYMSSAPKNKRVFAHSEISRAYPQVDGQVISILRSRAHWSAYLIHRRPGTPEADSRTETIRALHRSLKLMDEGELPSFEDSKSFCSSCPLRGGKSHPCSRVDLCQSFSSHARAISNLSIGANIEEYRKVLEDFELVGRAPERASYYIDILKAVLNRSDVKDPLLERMRVLERIVDYRSDLTRAKPAGVEPIKTRDLITVSVQHWPIKISVTSPEYRSILRELTAYYTLPIGSRSERQDVFDKAYANFIRLGDAGKGSAEYELLHCLIYLALPKVGGDDRALRHALQMCEVHTELEAEYLYVSCWAARRLGRFELADTLARYALAIREDARFHHSRALNTYAWVLAAGETRERTMSSAAESAEKAIEGYRKENPRVNVDLIGANLHNLSYFCSFDEKYSCYDLTRARSALDELKKVILKKRWSPRFPEYFHAEALLEYREFEQMRKRGKPRSEQCRKLICAQDEITQAVLWLEKPGFRDLQRRIEKAIGKLDCAGFTKAPRR